MNTIRKILITTLLSVCFYVVSWSQITMSIGSMSVCNAGDSITIPVTVTGFNAVGSLSIKITYNPAVLSFGRTLNWDANFLGTVEGNNATAGTLAESWILQTDPVTITDGKLFDIKFKSLGNSSDVE